MSSSEEYEIFITDELDKAVNTYRDIYLENIIEVYKYDDISDIKIKLQIDISSSLSKDVAMTWGISLDSYICIDLEVVSYPEEVKLINLYQFVDEEKKAHYQLVMIIEKMLKEHTDFIYLNKYLLERIGTLNKYCCLCDKYCPKNYMVKQFVCNDILCVYRHQVLQICSEINISTDSNIVRILVLMAYDAIKSKRRELIFDPYPLIVSDDMSIILDPNKKDYDLALSMMEDIPKKKENYLSSLEYLKTVLDINIFRLFNWIQESNMTTISNLPDIYKIKEMETDQQFIIIMDSPEKNASFQELKTEHGSTFGFHGSGSENWHSILRHGLKNASGTALQINGASHGDGIYLCKEASYSYGYSKKYSSFICMAICEYVDIDTNKSDNIIVVKDPDHVCVRFLFVYEYEVGLKYEIDDAKLHAIVNEI